MSSKPNVLLVFYSRRAGVVLEGPSAVTHKVKKKDIGKCEDGRSDQDEIKEGRERKVSANDEERARGKYGLRKAIKRQKAQSEQNGSRSYDRHGRRPTKTPRIFRTQRTTAPAMLVGVSGCDKLSAYMGPEHVHP